MNERQEKELLVTVSNIDTRTARMDRDLFGNGQPGVVKEHCARIKKLERVKWLLTGGALVAIWVIERLVHR